MQDQNQDVLANPWPGHEKVKVLIGSERSCLGFWRRMCARFVARPEQEQPSEYVSVQTVEELRAIDPMRVSEILLMPDFRDSEDYAMFCAELSNIDFCYKIPIRSGEALG